MEQYSLSKNFNSTELCVSKEFPNLAKQIDVKIEHL